MASGSRTSTLAESRPLNPSRTIPRPSTPRRRWLAMVSQPNQNDKSPALPANKVKRAHTRQPAPDDDRESSTALVLYNPNRPNGPNSRPEPPTFEDVRRITIARSELERWHARGPATLDRLIPGWRMTEVADSPPLKEEFEHLVRESTRFGGYVPSRDEVLEKIELVENVRAGSDEMRIGWNDGTGGGREAARLAELNQRNRVENFKNTTSSGGTGWARAHDSFSRRWTKPRNYYHVGGSGHESSLVGPEERSRGLAQMAGVGPHVNRGIREPNKLHDFELRVSLVGLEKFGGPNGVRDGYLANKGRVEGRQGFRVPEDDVAAHPRAMSVEEYRRRRGLI
ncbi:Unknown protein [Striga hermonthica]|uniref:Uncharacterized protein n=1 Tax=Striga hermonthica TaxID=68872 RepID=A0A9N7NSV4_STRHE|nr:Unknown protein [Striga hermonthica]